MRLESRRHDVLHHDARVRRAGVFFDASGAGDFATSTGLSFSAENVTYPADPALIFLPTFGLTERMTLGSLAAVGVTYDNSDPHLSRPAFNLIMQATLTASASFFPMYGAFLEEFRVFSNLGGGPFSLYASNASDDDGVQDGVYHYSASHEFTQVVHIPANTEFAWNIGIWTSHLLTTTSEIPANADAYIDAGHTVTLGNFAAFYEDGTPFDLSQIRTPDGFHLSPSGFVSPAAPAVPEPTSMLLIGTGLASLAVGRYRRSGTRTHRITSPCSCPRHG